MDPEVYDQTKSRELATSMSSYGSVKNGYLRMIRDALRQKDGKARSASLQSIVQTNQRLSAAVNRLLRIWTDGNRELSTYSKYKIRDLKNDLQLYKKQLGELKSLRDETTKLKGLKETLENTTFTNKMTYFGLIAGALVLLLVVFILFVYRMFVAPTPTLFAPAPATYGGRRR
jgi:hypothetical protein